MKTHTLFISISFPFLILFCGSHIAGNLSQAYAQQDWKQEFAATCSETSNAMTLSPAELKNYIARCDKLFLRIDELDGMEGGSEKKVYAKRLKMCRDLYEFTLEHKNK